MSAIPLSIGPHGDRMTAHATRPLFGCIDQHLSDSPRTEVLIHNKPVYFHIAVRFNAPEEISSDPARDLASRKFGNKNGIMVPVLHLAQSLANLLPCRRIAELYREASHGVAVARLSWANHARRAQCHDIEVFVHFKAPFASGDRCIATGVRSFFRTKTADHLQESATPDAVSRLCATDRLDVSCDTGEGLRRRSHCARWGGGCKQTPFRTCRC